MLARSGGLGYRDIGITGLHRLWGRMADELGEVLPFLMCWPWCQPANVIRIQDDRTLVDLC